jgi:hypothetical protein
MNTGKSKQHQQLTPIDRREHLARKMELFASSLAGRMEDKVLVPPRIRSIRLKELRRFKARLALRPWEMETDAPLAEKIALPREQPSRRKAYQLRSCGVRTLEYRFESAEHAIEAKSAAGVSNGEAPEAA